MKKLILILSLCLASFVILANVSAQTEQEDYSQRAFQVQWSKWC